MNGKLSGRASAANALKKSTPISYTDSWRAIFEADCFLDSREFKEYAARVEAVVIAAAAGQDNDFRGIPTRAIHMALGAEANPAWTMDALSWLKAIESVGVLPTRYRPRCGAKPRNIPSHFNNREVGGD